MPEEKESLKLKSKIFASIKIKITPITEFQEVWSSAGTHSRTHATIWAPKLAQSRSSLQICIGHYATVGFGNPKDSSPRYTLEINDQSYSVSKDYSLEAVADQLMPFPVKYHQVWSKERCQQALYVWQPIPPSKNHTVLGFICTTTPEEPPLTLVRCLPTGWCVKSKRKPEKVWDDSGTGGKMGSIWTINFLQLMGVVLGHDAPMGVHYEVWKQEFWASQRQNDVKWDADETATHCFDCKKAFSTFNRRHHCRVCGHIYCNACTSERVPMKEGNQIVQVRACNVCLQRPELIASLKAGGTAIPDVS